MKYVIIGFDDNTVYDRKAVEILNKYKLKGTFFINSGTLNNPGFLEKEELDILFEGHEVASHTVNHPRLKELTHEGIKYQILEDIDNLKAYSKQNVRGFAYPFGDYNKKVKDMAKECGVAYARTVKNAKDWKKPKDFLEWHPTMHFTGMAWDTDDEARIQKGVNYLIDQFEEFLEDYFGQIFYVWLHSWELKDDLDRWDMFERFCKLVSNEDEIESITAIEYVEKVSKK